MAHQALVRLLITVYISVCVSIVSAVERFAAHLARERLVAGMNANVFLVVLRIHER